MKIDCERGTYLMKIQMMLKFLLFAAQIFHSCGNVILLRGESHTISSLSEKKYICLSEDDGGALVWNDDSSRNQKENRNDLRFTSTHIHNTWINCSINADIKSCFKFWDQENWIPTSSIKTPMGPVFDQRWEEFQEFRWYKHSENKINILIPLSGAISISFRSSHNVQIFLCRFFFDHLSQSRSCWRITLKYDSTDSTIDYCDKIDTLFTHQQCSSNIIRKRLLSLSETEWRTFVISWDTEKKNVSVYDTNNEMLTFEDAETFTLPPYDYVFFRIPTENRKLLYRLHRYDFLYTLHENAILMSPFYTPNTHEICTHLLLGLCAECDAVVVLIDSKTNKTLKSVTAKGSVNAAIHGLPMWQIVTLNETFSTVNYSGSVKIHVLPKLTKSSKNPLWAISYVRQCPSKEVLRKGIISQPNKSFLQWWNVTCQKLFFNKIIVVSSLSNATNSTDVDDKICPEGRIGPDCSFSCKHDLNSSANCSGTATCYTSGCICSSGFKGDTCSELCDDNWYGYNCRQKCGLCKSFGCNKVTGKCINGCDDSLEMVYVPPLCHIGIKTLTKPEIVSVTSTSIRTKLSVPWKQEYEQIMIKYSFSIKEVWNDYNFTQSWSRLFPNMTHLTGYFNNLNPGSIYSVKCALIAENIIIESNWQIVETDCEPVKTFNVWSTENSIIIDWQIISNQLSLCPAQWYDVILINRNTDENISNSTVITFPYEVSDLPSYTDFNVIVIHPRLAGIIIKNSFMYFTHIRTLRSVSAKVLDIQYFANSSTQVTLKWNSPDHLNLVMYEITLKIILYYGCEDFNLPTPDVAPIKKFTNKTEIIFSDLHPYASYTAQVTTHEFQSSSYDFAELTFNTDKSDIPAEVFTKLEAQNWTLSWQPPKDCSTISGPLNAKIHISGVSTAVRHFSAIKFTSRWYFDLNIINPPLLRDEQYRAIVYVVREYNSTENSSAYQELCFSTPSTAPPTIANLEVVEIDTRQVPHVLHLRWLISLSSSEKQVHYYNITTYCKRYVNTNKMKIKQFCNLWNDYVCVNIYFCEKSFYEKSFNIQVFEINKTNTALSSPAIVSQEMFIITKPDKPAPVTYILHNNSIVDLLWYHPWKTSRPLQCFLITVEESTSYLKQRISQSTAKKIYKYPVEEYMRNYTQRLYLYPSTSYRIYIQSMTITNETSLYNYVNIQTPSTATFDDVLHDVADDFNSTISLKVPHVLNDTFDSCIHIIVKGHNRCKNYSKIPEKIPENLLKQANVKKTDVAWQAAEILTDEIARNNYTFIVGDNRTYGGARNCPLQSNRLYDIIVILTEQRSIFRISYETIMLKISTSIGEVPDSVPYEIWLIIPIILLLLIAATVSYIYRRRRRQIFKQIMSQNEMEVWQNTERMTVFSNNRN